MNPNTTEEDFAFNQQKDFFKEDWYCVHCGCIFTTEPMESPVDQHPYCTVKLERERDGTL